MTKNAPTEEMLIKRLLNSAPHGHHSETLSGLLAGLQRTGASNSEWWISDALMALIINRAFPGHT